ncbi:MAG: hypothetical protein ACREPM_14450 [Gemmatimonadaceae bacterium]
MIATIEWVWRRVKHRPLVPLAVLVIGVRVPIDPAHRTTGYVGVLPVPAFTAAGAAAPHSDIPMDQTRRDVRAARGRVLYATGHAPQSTSQRAERKAACPDRRVGQSKSVSQSPTS